MNTVIIFKHGQRCARCHHHRESLLRSDDHRESLRDHHGLLPSDGNHQCGDHHHRESASHCKLLLA